MVFFAQKVLRKLPGNWTFVVVTDRSELDDQIYKNFAGPGAVTEPRATHATPPAASTCAAAARNHRYVFTLIHKFHTDAGRTYPVLSERSTSSS
jgi:type I restriction enzyme, R subunit